MKKRARHITGLCLGLGAFLTWTSLALANVNITGSLDCPDFTSPVGWWFDTSGSGIICSDPRDEECPFCGDADTGETTKEGDTTSPSTSCETGGCGGKKKCPDCQEGAMTGPDDYSQVANLAMVRWSVFQPFLSVWLNDVPMTYRPKYGPRVELKLIFNSNRGFAGLKDSTAMNVFGFGPGWSSPWRSYVRPAKYADQYYVFDGYGKARIYTRGVATDSLPPNYNAHDGSWLEDWSAVGETGFTLNRSNGTRDVYATQVIDDINGEIVYFLTRRETSTGQAITFAYDEADTNPATGDVQLRLRTVTDAAGDTTSLLYTNVGGFGSLIWQVTNVFGAKVVLTYDANAHLISIQDVAQLPSQITYDTTDSNRVASVITPYGTNKFQYLSFADTNYYALHVNEKELRHHLWVFGNLPTNPWTGISGIKDDMTNYLTYVINTTGDTNFGSYHFDDFTGRYAGNANAFADRTSAYWGPRQFQNLPQAIRDTVITNNFSVTALSTNDYNLCDLVRWRRGNGKFISDAKSIERLPGPSSTEPGPVTFFDYSTDSNNPGGAKAGLWTQPTHVMTATHNADPNGSGGNLWSASVNAYNEAGMVTGSRSLPRPGPMAAAGVPDAVEFKKFFYMGKTVYTPHRYRPPPVTGTVGYDPLGGPFPIEKRPIGRKLGGQRGNQVLVETNAVGDLTTYTYDPLTQYPSQISASSGKSWNILFDMVGQITNKVVTGTDGNPAATNSTTYLNNDVRTTTAPSGLTLTYDRDYLGRLTKVAFPDGSSISNRYENLDLVERIDRMGNHEYWSYDRFRQVTGYTNALGTNVVYTYCDCGTLDSVKDGAGSTTAYSYDNRARLTHLTYPGGSYVDRKYDEFDNLTNVVYSGGNQFKVDYDLQNRVVARWANVGGTWLCSEANTYDGFGRLQTQTNLNGLSVTFTYDDLDRVTQVDHSGAPSEGFVYADFGITQYTDQLGKVTNYGYDPVGRRNQVQNPLLNSVWMSYSPSGRLLYLTNELGKLTQWAYDVEGRLTRKLDDTGKTNFLYEYNTNGWLTGRSMPPLSGSSFAKTVYSYDAIGNLTNVAYPDSTSLRYSYDGNRRVTIMNDWTGTTLLSYTPFGRIATEDGPWNDDTVSYGYDTNRWLNSLGVALPGGGSWQQQFVRDEAGRLDLTTTPVGTFDYTYQAATAGTYLGSLLKKIDVPFGGVRTNTYDSLGRLLSTAAMYGTTTLDSHAYVYDGGNRRTRQTRTASEYLNGSYVDFTYDDMGELLSAAGSELPSGPSRVHEQFAYKYDAAGNLTNRAIGTGAGNQVVETFTPDSLNELTNVWRNTAFTVSGRTTTNATNVNVTFSGSTVAAALYKDGSFARQGITLANGNNTFTVTAKDAQQPTPRTATHTLTLALATNVNLSYDARGNLRGDGRRVLNYDEENQLVEVYETNKWRSTFAYDGMLRRRIRKEYTWATSWVQTNEFRYVYSGATVLQERNAQNLPAVTYSRGPDLSGGLQEAGGIGGLLARTDHATGKSALYHSDGRGDVTSLFAGATLLARYSYDPYGNVMGATGPYADLNLYRFSGKEAHVQSGLVYYGFRFYDPNIQRWPNRDPLGEEGGINLYRYAFNDPLDWIDTDGLEPVSYPHYNKGGVMVHSEVPVPGGGAGGVHIQIGDQKWHYNTQTGGFEGKLPKDVEKLLRQDKKFRGAVEKACKRVNSQGGFAPKYGGGIGRYIPALAALLTLAQGSAIADDVDRTARDYLRGLEAGEDVSAEAAILRNQLNNLAPLAGEVTFPTLLR